MASLKGRLSRLRDLGLVKASMLGDSDKPADGLAGGLAGGPAGLPASGLATEPASGLTDRPAFLKGWDALAPHVWTRVVETPLRAPGAVRPSTWLHLPDDPELRSPEAFSFFDFETTGLSGGAGTLPFLAAIGAFAGSGFFVTQVLIDDYPGETTFLEYLLAELGGRKAVVTYNGSSFDMPLLRSRCIMNGIPSAEPIHLDALHPARRLWKRSLSSCSLKVIEAEILGLDRGEDIPGSAIPRVWLDFASGRGEGEMGLVCSHNASDITTLARLFLRIDRIFAEPLNESALYRVDAPRLGLALAAADRISEATALLEPLAADGDPRSGFALCRIYRRQGMYDERRRVAMAMPDIPEACVLKAKICEHSLRDYPAALEWTEKALAGLSRRNGGGNDPGADSATGMHASGALSEYRACTHESLESRSSRLKRKIALKGA